MICDFKPENFRSGQTWEVFWVMRKKGNGSVARWVPLDPATLLWQLSHASATRSFADKNGYFIQIIPHMAREKGLVCNHQRNADRIHSIILMRIQDLFWRSFLDFFLPVPLSPNEAICIHGASEAHMKSDHSQTWFRFSGPSCEFQWCLVARTYSALCLEN